MAIYQAPDSRRSSRRADLDLMENSSPYSFREDTPRTIPCATYLPDRTLHTEIERSKPITFPHNHNGAFESATRDKDSHHRRALRCDLQDHQRHGHGYNQAESAERLPVSENCYPLQRKQRATSLVLQSVRCNDLTGPLSYQRPHLDIYYMGSQFGTSLPRHDYESMSPTEDAADPVARSGPVLSQTISERVSEESNRYTHRCTRLKSVKSPETIEVSMFGNMLRKGITSLDVDLAEQEEDDLGEQSESELDERLDVSLRSEIENSLLQTILLCLASMRTAQGCDNYADADGSPTSPATHSTATTNTSSSRKRSGDALADSRGAKRAREKARDNQNGDEEEDDLQRPDGADGEDGDTAGLAASEHHELACHYNKLYPQRFCRGSEYGNKYQACSGSFKDIAAITQHFRERHYYGDRVCARCLRQFGSKQTCIQHFRADPVCPLREHQSIELEMPLLPLSDRRQRLERVGKRKHSVSNEKQWSKIWEALFPSHPCPDPHRRLNSLERDYDRAVKAHIPELIRELLSTHTDLDIVAAEAHCRRFAEAIRNRLSPYFHGGYSLSTGSNTEDLPMRLLFDNNMTPIASLTYASSLSTFPMDNSTHGYSTAHVMAPDPLDAQSQASMEPWNAYDAAAMNGLLPQASHSFEIPNSQAPNYFRSDVDLDDLSRQPYSGANASPFHSKVQSGHVSAPPNMFDHNLDINNMADLSDTGGLDFMQNGFGYSGTR